MHKTTDRTVAKACWLWSMSQTLLSVSMLWVVAYATALHAAQPQTIDPRRSLVVTEQVILARFSFERVMNQLVAQSGVAGLTALALFHQWWDTQNPGPGLGLGPHCDDEVDDLDNPILNGFPYTCRPDPAEGVQAGTDPFIDPDHDNAYLPIGLFNRFDLAPGDGAHCGEYRIVYAKRSGILARRQRNLLIFEAILPNPRPNQELKGCKEIVDFWAKLSKTHDINKRADALERLYFQGLENVEPVVHVNHYGDNPNQAGQVRTNQFMQDFDPPVEDPPRSWSLLEFKLKRTCSGGSCSTMQFIPVTNKVNPFGPLHDSGSMDPKALNYQTYFLTQVADLAADSVTGIRFAVPDEFNSGQSLASGSDETDYLAHFQAAADPSFKDDIQAKLTEIGSILTPDHIIKRALSQSCAGCHRLLNNTEEKPDIADIGNGLVWPASLGFTHVTESATEVVDGQTRFLISPALLEVFIPQRQQIMEDYLNSNLKKPKKPKDTLSGRKIH